VDLTTLNCSVNVSILPHLSKKKKRRRWGKEKQISKASGFDIFFSFIFKNIQDQEDFFKVFQNFQQYGKAVVCIVLPVRFMTWEVLCLIYQYKLC